MRYLTPQDLKNVAIVSQAFYVFSSIDDLWKEAVLFDFGGFSFLFFSFLFFSFLFFSFLFFSFLFFSFLFFSFLFFSFLFFSFLFFSFLFFSFLFFFFSFLSFSFPLLFPQIKIDFLKEVVISSLQQEIFLSLKHGNTPTK